MNLKTVNDWLEWIESIHSSEIELGLKRVDIVRDRLSIPTKLDIPVITISGTNGKGSTAAYIESILTESGRKVGVYSSPHITHFNERIRINGKGTDNRKICTAFSKVKDAIEQDNPISLTYFEFVTLAALVVFIKEQLDVIVLEVGLGGRLDAVNIIDPACAVITNISYDHQDWLGNTLEKIAREKAGIMRKGVPVIYAGEDAQETIKETAKKIEAKLYLLNEQITTSINKNDWNFTFLQKNIIGIPLPDAGYHQQINAATATAAILLCNIDISDKEIKNGITKEKLQGRTDKFTRGYDCIVDVAHNPDSIAKLITYLKNNPSKGKNIALFSILKRKDIDAVLNQSRGVFDKWLLVKTADPDSHKDTTLQQIFATKAVNEETESLNTTSEAINYADNNLSTNDRLVVFGSFRVVSEFYSQIKINPKA